MSLASSIPFIVARKELRELARDRQVLWAGVIVWLLVAAAVATAWPEHRRRAVEREALAAAARDQWVSQGAKNPHTAAHFGVYAIKPQTPLAIFDPGVTTFVGTHILLEAHWQNPQQGRAADESPASYRLGSLSPASVLQQLLPLVVILLGYQAIAGERERGTWALLTAQGATAAQVGAGKLLAISAVLVGLLLPPLALATFAALGVANDRDVLLRGGLLVGLYIVYALTWLALTVSASARASSSRRALIVMLGFWIVSTLVVPRAVVDVARLTHRTPSAFSFHEAIYGQKAQGLDGHDPRDARVEALRIQTLTTYGVSKVEDLPLNFDGLALQADEEYGNALFERAYGSLWQTFDRQTDMQRLAGIVAPIQALRFASMALAGTDSAHDRGFVREAEGYRRALVRAMNDDLTHRSKNGDFSYFGDRSTWSRVPEFRYTSPRAAWALGQEWLSCAFMSAWSGASMIGLFATLRSDRLRAA
jgi:ABC-2 type transport system permease protein